MINWKCPNCARYHESEDDIKFVVCKGCLSSMEKFPYNFEKEKEVTGDGKRDCFEGD